jgi:uncharacterized membrane protein
MIGCKSRFLVFCGLLLILVSSASAQNYNPFNQRDDTYRLLGLKRSKQAYETAQAEYDRQQQLFDKGLITQLELDRAHSLYTDAEVNYQQSLLAVLFEKQYITVAGAVKYQAADGSKHVRLTLANASGGSAEFQKLIQVDDALFRSLQPDIINNIYVSILNESGAIVSQPYEAKIERLQHGRPADLDFTLLEDLDAVTVSMIYANGNQRTMKIFLQKDASVDRVLVQSEQFSQEVELGTSSSFDLTLELFSGTSNTFSLEVVNLPREIGRYFKAPTGSVRLSQVKFTESARTKRAALQIELPDRSSTGVAMDTPIPFFVLVLPREQARAIDDLHTRQWTEEEIKALKAGYVRLELVARGVGKLMVRLPQLYHAIDLGETARPRLEVLNEGSHGINDIEFKVDLPLNWTKSIEPDGVPSLDIGRDAAVDLALSPPEGIAPGKYEIRLRTSGMSNGRPISAEDKTITVEVRADTNVFGTVLIVALLLSLVGGIVVYGTRLSRR